MKVRGQMIRDDGFEKNVAEKMPKIRKEEFPPPDFQEEPQLLEERHPEINVSEEPPERNVILQLPKRGTDGEPSHEVLRLIEDLHTQLLVSSRTKRALEIDLTSSQRSINQLAQDNRDLRHEAEDLRKELQRLKEIQAESMYLKEENTDALEKIQELQEELKGVRETLEGMAQQKDEALNRIRDLEAHVEQAELLRVKERLREREAIHFSEENKELRSRLEEAQLQYMELERKYEELRRSFNDVRESLTVLRDSCKKNYYNLSQTPE